MYRRSQRATTTYSSLGSDVGGARPEVTERGDEPQLFGVGFSQSSGVLYEVQLTIEKGRISLELLDYRYIPRRVAGRTLCVNHWPFCFTVWCKRTIRRNPF